MVDEISLDSGVVSLEEHVEGILWLGLEVWLDDTDGDVQVEADVCCLTRCIVTYQFEERHECVYMGIIMETLRIYTYSFFQSF